MFTMRSTSMERLEIFTLGNSILGGDRLFVCDIRITSTHYGFAAMQQSPRLNPCQSMVSEI
jgi:hypothetical protein